MSRLNECPYGLVHSIHVNSAVGPSLFLRVELTTAMHIAFVPRVELAASNGKHYNLGWLGMLISL